MATITRLMLTALLLALLGAPQSGRAAPPVITINCNTAVHIADFQACATERAIVSGPASYVTFSASHYTIVNVAAQYTIVQLPYSGTLGIWVVTSAKMIQQNGQPAITDADLNVSSATLLAALKGNIPGLNIDPDQVYSLLNVEFPEILTNQIDSGLLSALGPGYAYVTPIGTTIMVTCTGDGTNAQFKRISMTGSVQWEMVPNTLKNKKGQFIDSKGNVIANSINNGSLGTLLAALPGFPGNGLDTFDWGFWSTLPNGTITIGDLCDPEIPC